MTTSKDKLALVLGGAGFLGSFLCDTLIQSGHSVTCLDNFYTGSRRNIAHLIDSPNFQLLEQDVTQPFDIDSVGQIFNLACPASPVHYQRDPIFTLRTNFIGTFNALELAKRKGAAIFQASTSEVYGDPLIHPQTEIYWGHVNPIGIRSCYDEGKRCAETLCFDYHRLYQLDIRVGRIFNTYGPRMDPNDGRVVSNFIVQALKGEPITIYGSGQQTRSFCYVSDLISAITQFMDSPSNYTGPLNLGNPNEFTILELARLVIQYTGSRSALINNPLPLDDPKQRQPDIVKTKEILGWEPKVALSEGLKLTIHYFEQLLTNGHLIDPSPKLS